MEGNPGTMWGPRQAVVVSKVWNRFDVKFEFMTAEAANGAVVRGLVYCGVSTTVHMAVGGGGASVIRAHTMAPVPHRATPTGPSVFRQQWTRVATNPGRKGRLVGGC